MRYPDYMTDEDIELFELDMERFYEDSGLEYDQINHELRLLAIVEQAEQLDFHNV